LSFVRAKASRSLDLAIAAQKMPIGTWFELSGCPSKAVQLHIAQQTFPKFLIKGNVDFELHRVYVCEDPCYQFQFL
jgi:hypothetical protein